ncbi:MAG: hypothetical protein ACI9G1_000419 [Pirellulaceae bacterium]|jgi:hypothetical protein
MNVRPLLLALLLPFAAISFVQSAVAQDEIPAEVSKRLADFFGDLSSSEVQSDEAFRLLLAGGPLEKRAADVKKLIDRFAQLKNQYGAYLEHERVDSQAIGSDLLILKYLYKAEDYPILWKFTLYRKPSVGNASPWRVISVSFGTRLESLTGE